MEEFMKTWYRHDQVVALIKHSVEFLKGLEAERKESLGALKDAPKEDWDRLFRNFIRNAIWVRDEKAELDRLSYEEQWLSQRLKTSENFVGDLYAGLQLRCSDGHWRRNKGKFFRGFEN
jgi:hypothetical protein